MTIVSISGPLAEAKSCQNLTLYDAAYLELAMRRTLALATLDADLRKAAKRVGVGCLPGRL